MAKGGYTGGSTIFHGWDSSWCTGAEKGPRRPREVGVVKPRSAEEQAAFEKFKAVMETKKSAEIWPSNSAYAPPKTPKLKKKSRKQAANAGDRNAQYELGTLCLKTKPPKLAKARNWFSAAAGAGHALAQHDLGVMIFNGDGGPANPVEGCMWLALASAHGVQTEMFAKAAAMLTDDEIAEARRLACDWKVVRPGGCDSRARRA